MADYAVPKYGVAYIFYTSLQSQADTKLLKSAPTLASGDFKVSIDGGAFANLTTLPTNTPGGVSVKISLSAAEMSGDNIVVTCIDAAGAEWCDQTIVIQTSPRGIADLAYPATSGRSLAVDASGVVDANVAKWLTVAPNALVSGKVDATLAVRGGTAQAGAAGSLTLDAGASATDNIYRGLKLAIVSGTGAGQQRLISGYTGSSKVATVIPNWVITPDNTSVFIVAGHCAVDVEQVALTNQTARDLGAQLDAQVSTRLASAGYTAPDNTNIATIVSRTDVATSTRLASGSYTAPDNATIGGISTALTALAAKFSGLTTVAGWLRTLARKTAGDATALSEINTGGTGTFVPSTMSLEVLPSISGGGGGGGSDPLTNLVPGTYAAGTAGAALGRIGDANAISVTSPLSAAGDLTLIAGDDYRDVDGRALEFSNTAGTWPDLTGATITLVAIRNGSTLIEVAGAVVTPTGSQLVTVEPTATDLAAPANAAASWEYIYGVYASLSNGHKVTLQTGKLTLIRAH